MTLDMDDIVKYHNELKPAVLLCSMFACYFFFLLKKVSLVNNKKIVSIVIGDIFLILFFISVYEYASISLKLHIVTDLREIISNFDTFSQQFSSAFFLKLIDIRVFYYIFTVLFLYIFIRYFVFLLKSDTLHIFLKNVFITNTNTLIKIVFGDEKIYYSLVILILSVAMFTYCISEDNFLKLTASISSNILSSLIFWMILGCFYVKFSESAHEFKRFFGLKKRNTICVLLSNTIVYANGNMSCANEKCEHYNICCLQTINETETAFCSYLEVSSLNCINRAIKLYPRKNLDIVKGLVDSFWELVMPDVKSYISLLSKPKHLIGEEIDVNLFSEFDSFIIVGSTNKNSHRRKYLDKAKFKFTWESDTTTIDRFDEKEKLNIACEKKYNTLLYDDSKFHFSLKHNGHSTPFNTAIIEKITLKNGKCIFFCNGCRADDSLIAVNYLFLNWHTILKKYVDHNNDFSLFIGTKFTDTQKTFEKVFEMDKSGSEPCEQVYLLARLDKCGKKIIRTDSPNINIEEE